MELFFHYLCQGNSKVAAFGQVVHLEEVHLIVERVQVVVWISLPLVAWYLGHLKLAGKGFLLNLLCKRGVIVFPYLFGSDDKVFNMSSQLV